MITVPVKYAYLVGSIVFLVFWLGFFLVRKDLRKEMLVMSLLAGILGVFTEYYWWTADWWHPPTVTGTRVGFEDFLLGFTSGGITAIAYEVLFKRRLYHLRSKNLHYPGFFTILLLLAFSVSWLFWGVGLTSFLASTLAMLIVSATMLYFRRDLFFHGILSGFIITIVSFVSYLLIIFLSPEWASETYKFQYLSNIYILGIPVEDFVWWFMLGLVFGPIYEYWQGERCRKYA